MSGGIIGKAVIENPTLRNTVRSAFYIFEITFFLSKEDKVLNSFLEKLDVRNIF